jgi:hypothetical protein
MGNEMNRVRCQIQCVPPVAEPIARHVRVWQRRNRIRRIFKRRWAYLINIVMEKKSMHNQETESSKAGEKKVLLQPGDTVRVRSKEEIKSTLNRWNQLKRCAFMEEMWPYCGTIQQVHKRVERFLDERDYLLKKCKGIILLKDVFCEGTKDFGSCDRSCFYFWREEWLEKI